MVLPVLRLPVENVTGLPVLGQPVGEHETVTFENYFQVFCHISCLFWSQRVAYIECRYIFEWINMFDFGCCSEISGGRSVGVVLHCTASP